MLSSAVSALLVPLTLAGQVREGTPFQFTSGQSKQHLGVRITPDYSRLLPSLATLVSQGQALGTAVLIDRTGLYLATRDSIVAREGEAIFSNNQRGHLTVVSEDRWTQLVLLRSDYVPPDAEPVVLASDTPPGTSLLIILRTGSVSARIESDSRLGMVKASNRVVPLSELRMEMPQASLGNSPVFTTRGEFVGLLSSTLTKKPENVATEQHFANTKGGFGGAGAASTSAFARMGPAELAVAYLPSPEAMKLVIDGFCSPEHAVDHASVGVFCADGPQGALVEEVVPGSPASQIGMIDGDEITAMGDYLIRNKSDFAKALFKYKAGERIMVRFDREGKSHLRELMLGKSAD